MKKFILSAGMLISTLAYAQVGINNQDPKSTLDVTAKTTDGSTAEGFIAPRLTGDALSTAETGNKYGVAQNGTIVYVTAAATTPGTGQTQNVTSVGYYYFDGSKWQKVSTGTSSASSGSGYDYTSYNNTTSPSTGITYSSGEFSGMAGQVVLFKNMVNVQRVDIQISALPPTDGTPKWIKFIIFNQYNSSSFVVIAGKVYSNISGPNGYFEYTCINDGTNWKVLRNGAVMS